MIIDVLMPTVTGREDLYKLCTEAYHDLSKAEIHIWTVKDRPTCGEAWNDCARLVPVGKRGHMLHFSADDIEPLQGWDEAAELAARRGHNPCPRLLNPDGSVYYYGLAGSPIPDGSIVQISTIPTMTWEQWDKIQPCLPIHYYSDNYLSWRLERLGYPAAYYSGYAFVHHWGAARRGAGMNENDRMVHDHQIFLEATR